MKVVPESSNWSFKKRKSVNFAVKLRIKVNKELKFKIKINHEFYLIINNALRTILNLTWAIVLIRSFIPQLV